jgi:dGTPase
MSDFGGFEGNAQTLHILAKVEKKEVLEKTDEEFIAINQDGSDLRCGLNLTYRTLASVLKYDNLIPTRRLDRVRSADKKGYYYDETGLVGQIKTNVLGAAFDGPFKTVECSIMDIADDIAYSTYDLEDCFKAKFLTPLDLFTIDDSIKARVVSKINERVEKYYGSDALNRPFASEDLVARLFLVFEELFQIGEREKKFLIDRRASREEKKLFTSLQVKRLSESIAGNGYERAKLTSELVQLFMDGVEVVPHDTFPQLHTVRLDIDTFITVEVLKNITYEAIIMSPRVKIVEYRGKDIIRSIFHAIDGEKGNLLLPDDYRELYNRTGGVARKRVICDFIAGMTDRYAWEFYNRLFGTNTVSIHLPV